MRRGNKIAPKRYRRGRITVIIDGHVHIYPPEFERSREKIAEREPWFKALTESKVHKWGTAEELIEAMDAAGIECAIAGGFAFLDQGLCRESNDYVLDAARRHPDRIVPMAAVSPAARGMEREIERCAEMGAVGIGELFPDGQGFDISDRRQTWRLAGAADERGLFIMLHTAEQVGHSYAGKGRTGAREAAAFCLGHPGTRVIFAHFGGGLWAYEAMPEMRMALADARYDTAAWPWLYSARIADAIFASGAGDKIIFGSDWPILKFARYGKLIGESKITEEERNKLLYINAGKLLSGD
jgi:predicted TIM-barrel fold metal-dependent hydrolase